jgi:hypothetical protein
VHDDRPYKGTRDYNVQRDGAAGFSSRRLGPDRFLGLSDNGFGRLENSADFLLRAHRFRVDLRDRDGGSGRWRLDGHISLRDPDRKIPFAIVNQFTRQRLLTGADFDVDPGDRARSLPGAARRLQDAVRDQAGPPPAAW